MPLKNTLRHALAPCLALAASTPWAQTPAPAAPSAAASAPARPAAATAPARPAAATEPARPAATPAAAQANPAPAATSTTPAATPQRVEVTGGRDNDTTQRRQATAAKIVIGREEIDKFGDATLGEVLRRLPGVTTPGAPGRGGPPRMRGLGGGFTQLLIDGQRMPPGFSLESLTPEQVERIEILRAPTAETGARAIAGTINIITREGFRRRLNDFRLGFGLENGEFAPGVNWTHNDSAGNLTYNISGSLFQRQREDRNQTRTTVQDGASGSLLEDRTSNSLTNDKRLGVNLTSRLQWRLGEGTGDMLALMPFVFHTENKGRTGFTLNQALRRPSTPALYDLGESVNEGSFTNARLNTQWRQRVGDVRAELNGAGGLFRSSNDSRRTEFVTGAALPLRTLEDSSRTRQTSLDLKFKFSGVTGGGLRPGATADAAGAVAPGTSGAPGGAPAATPTAEHSLVGGLDIDASNRTETRSTLQNGVSLLPGFGDELKASSLRLAAFAQDEWNISPKWGAHAGLRWEGITTRGDNGGSTTEPRPTNRSSVWTPLLHAVYKPDPKGRDQVRISLTRSYRSPDLGNLIARPSINRDYDPRIGSNIDTSPDSAGNPNLKPELATGVDIALERYLDSGGVLSANVFHRSISNLMRGATRLENVSWSSFPRWVRRMQNIGDATTSGLELEAKFRLDQLITGATPVEMRSNVSFFHSRVKSVPGPDNRLDQQAKATANLGADYRVRGTKLSLGGNVNWVPGYTTRVDADQTVTVSTKQVWDAYALWAFNPNVGLRLLGSNLNPRDYTNTNADDAVVAGRTERTTQRSTGPSFVNWQLRLELKL